MNAKVTAKVSEDMMTIHVTIDSPYGFIQKYAEKIGPLDFSG